MSISDGEMAHLKDLARLELTDEETEALRGDLEKLLGFFEQLRELDTEGVEELVRPVATVNVFRDDALRPGLSHQQAMDLAIEAQDGFFKVPRTVDTGE